MKMRIKNLFFLHLLLIFSIAGLAIYSGLKYQAFSVLDRAEKETLKTENRLIIRTIQNEIDRLVTLAKDWGCAGQNLHVYAEWQSRLYQGKSQSELFK